VALLEVLGSLVDAVPEPLEPPHAASATPSASTLRAIKTVRRPGKYE
jgi:hypothetical protein